jgi:hypothetical protein
MFASCESDCRPSPGYCETGKIAMYGPKEEDHTQFITLQSEEIKQTRPRHCKSCLSSHLCVEE